ncbi:MAG TPA: 3-oxoacyl-[acyl-carrier-protein] synthase III C-terminal domain-containing protein [Pseudonocardiaceae bacterium]|nr:3-oxoacyl-[acyl-carrier-protein] synthase III C-terminal domain-containing protein [Pseudonocardiaceae bacterium]
MDMTPLYLCGIEYVHGDRHDIAELAGQLDPDLLSPDTGLSCYRASDLAIWELAADAGARTLKAASTPPDLVIYMTENDHVASDSLNDLVRSLDLPDARYVRGSGHDCGNFGPALSLARQALASGEHRQVLILLADKVIDGDRSQADKLSVVSDGAAACLVTTEPPGIDGVRFAVNGISTVTDTEATSGSEAGDRILATVALAAAGTAAIAGQTGRVAKDFDHLLFPNYRAIAQQFLCSALAVPLDKLLFGPMAEFGHCFSADSLVSLAHCASTDEIRPGEHVLAFGDGQYSWSSLAIQRLG